MAKFKAGDVVKVVRNQPHRIEITVGSEYVVENQWGNLVKLVGIFRKFNQDRFELVAAAKPVEPFDTKRGGPFEKGDRVRCFDNNGAAARLSQDVGYIVERTETGTTWGGPYVFFEGDSAGWNPSRFELVAPREPSVDELIAETAAGRREFERLQTARAEADFALAKQSNLCRELEKRLNQAVATRVAQEAKA